MKDEHKDGKDFDFKINLLYNIYKDKHFRTCNELRKMFNKKYNLSYQKSNEIILRIINYQVDKYGTQLYDWNHDIERLKL